MRTGDLYQRYYGVFIGTVLDVEDPEKLGRVRIECDQFEDAEDNVFWANVARPAAGNKTGVFFTPKVGDQVIIGYLAGDVNEPLILGYAHSQKTRPPDQVSTRKHAVVTDIGYVLFDEVDGLIEVRLNAPESFIKLDKDGITISAPKVKIESTGALPAGIELTSPTPIQINSLAPIQITSTTAVGFGAPVIGFAGPPTFGPVGAALPSSPPTGALQWDLSAHGVEIKLDGKELCVDGNGVLLDGFALQLYDNHTHSGGGTGAPNDAYKLTGTHDPGVDETSLVTECGGTP